VGGAVNGCLADQENIPTGPGDDFKIDGDLV